MSGANGGAEAQRGGSGRPLTAQDNDRRKRTAANPPNRRHEEPTQRKSPRRNGGQRRPLTVQGNDRRKRTAANPPNRRHEEPTQRKSPRRNGGKGGR